MSHPAISPPNPINTVSADTGSAAAVQGSRETDEATSGRMQLEESDQGAAERDSGESEGEEAIEEEAEVVKATRDPGSLTKEELEEHRLTHYPYRCWCPHCVAGRAVYWRPRDTHHSDGLFLLHEG